MFAYGLMTPRDAAARSRNAALRAIDLSPGLAEPYTTLGGLLTFYDWEWEEAAASFEQALERNPGHATAHQWYGELLSFIGKSQQAEHHLKTALKFDPLSDIVKTMLGAHYMRLNRPDDALECLLQAVELGTDNDTTFAWAGFTLLELGDRTEAIKHFDEGCRRSGEAQFPLTMRAHAFALTGDMQPARDVLARLLEQQRTEWVSPTYIAILYLDLGENEKAAPWLEQAVRRHDSELIFMAIMPYYRDLRANPAAGPVLSVLGLSG
jgi:tetratricopeptide (TPR) repeat protein